MSPRMTCGHGCDLWYEPLLEIIQEFHLEIPLKTEYTTGVFKALSHAKIFAFC